MNINITQSLQKWENGSRARTPKKGTTAARIHLNKNALTLNSILKGVTPQSVGGEFKLGKDVGAERYE